LDGEKIQIVQNQAPFEYKSKGDILFRGKIDGMVAYKKELFPIEIKSMQKYAYDKIESFKDIAYSDSFYIRKYAFQLLGYLLTTEKEYGMFWLVNVANGQMKHIWVKLDYDFAEKIVKQAELVTECIKSNTLPDAKPDPSYCKMCSFNHICLPALAHNIPVIDNVELLENLTEREKYEEAKSLFSDADKKVKAMVKGQAELRCGDYLIQGHEVVKQMKATVAREQVEWHVKIINTKMVDKGK
jgi:CRISPR/Cas system-associated exonuclease Cas4 (RecB family)